MNNSNNFVSSLKWWPLQMHPQAHSRLATDGSGPTAHPALRAIRTATSASSVAMQKLRESKWFKREEQKIFCAVIECGFIVEVREGSCSKANARNHQSVGIGTQDENETPVKTWFGVVLCKTAKDNKAKPETIEICSVKIKEKGGTFKMIRMTLEDIWTHRYEIRINNFADKEKQAHTEKDIRNQVCFARKAKQSLWYNSKHFVYWCRYGNRQQDVRKRQMAECVKWGSDGMNAGMLLVMNKQKSHSTFR